MATELVTKIWCDVHLEEKDEHVPGFPMPPVDGRTVDLCAECAVPYVAVQQLLDTYGRTEGKRKYRRQNGHSKPAQPAPAADAESPELVCPDCGKVSKNKSALAAHGRRIHDKSFGELLGVDTPYACPDCDRRFSAPQGLGVHRRQVHPDAESG